VIELQSSDPSEIAVPVAVTLTAGMTRREFEVVHLDDDLLDGTQSVAVTARAAGRTEAVAVVACEDDEPGKLRLSLPVSMWKDDLRSALEAEVSTTRVVDKKVTVELHTDRKDLLRIPSHVDLMPGQIRVPFQIRATGDYRFSGDQQAVITARVANWTPAMGALTVQDLYRREILLRQGADIVEGAGSSELATLALPARLDSNLVIRLRADPPGILNLPAEVTVPAGASEIAIRALVDDDDLVQGTRLVTWTAEADGFEPASSQIRVIDNELGRLAIETSTRVVTAGESIGVTVTAQNTSGDWIPTFQGAFTLRPTREDGAPVGGGLPPEIHGFLTNGSWRGSIRPESEVPALVLAASTSDGVLGRSALIDVVNVRILPFTATHLIADPQRGRLLASVREPTVELPHGIVAIDPMSGVATSLLALEEGVSHLALSDDGVYLYAATETSPSVLRIHLGTAAVDLRWDLHAALEGRRDIPFLPPFGVKSLHPLPGRPRSVIVQFSPRFGVLFGGLTGVSVFDDDQLRPDLFVALGVMPDPASQPLQPPGDSARLLLFDPGVLNQGWIAPSGAVLERSLSGPRNVPSTAPPHDVPLQVTLADRVAYRSDGLIVDPERFEGRATAPVAGRVIREAAAGLLHYLQWNSAFREVVSVDVSTLRPVARLTLPGPSTGITFDFIRWGKDGLAFRTWEGAIHVLRSPHLVPSHSEADLGIAAMIPPAPLWVGEPIRCTIIVTNRGPALAEAVVVEDVLPPDTDLLETSLPTTQWSMDHGVAHFRLGQIPPGEQLRFEITVRSRTPLDTTHRMRVLGGALKMDDDVIELRQTTTFGSTLPRMTGFWVDGMALAYDRSRERLYISGVEPGSNRARLQVLDLNRGVFEPPMAVPELLSKPVVTADGQYLYGSVLPGDRNGHDSTSEARIDRVRLADGVVDAQFPVVDHFNQAHTVADLLTIPGRPQELLVARSGPQNDIALYASGRQVARSPVDLYAVHLTGIPGATDEFLAYSIKDSTELLRLRIQPSFLSVIGSAHGSLQRYSTGIWSAGGRVYDSSGTAADVQTLARVDQTAGGTLAAADPDEDLILFLRSEAGRWILRAFRASTSEALWFYDGLEPFHAARSFLSCGGGRFALLSDDGRLFLFQSRLMPGVPVADVAVVSELAQVDGAPEGRAWFDLHLEVTNRGPDASGAIVLTNRFPSNATLLEANVPYEPLAGEASGPDVIAAPGLGVRLSIPDGLGPQQSAKLRLRLQTPNQGTVSNEVRVTALSQDPDFSNNSDLARVLQPVNVDGSRVIEGFTAQDLVWDRSRNVVYVSSPGATAREDRVFRIDPVSGRMLEPLNTGRQPTLLALSHDERFLHVTVDAGETIERYDLATGTVDRRWDVGELVKVESMVVSPIEPNLVAVALQRLGGGSPRHAGVVLYRDGVALPERSAIPIWANTLAFSLDGSVLYGYDNETSGHGLHRFQVTPSGITLSHTFTGLMEGSSQTIAQGGGLLFASSGVVVDPALGRVIGRFPIDPPQYPELRHAMKQDAPSRSTFFAVGTGPNVRLVQYRTSDQALLGSVPLPATEAATAVDTWGDRGVAVALGTGGLFLTQFPLETPIADPELQLEVSTNLVHSGESLSYSVTITNRGSARADGLLIKIALPPFNLPIGVRDSTRGVMWFVPDGVHWALESVPPHGVASASFEVLVSGVGLLHARAELTSESADSDPSNNRISLYGNAVGAAERFHLPAVAAVYHPNQDRVFLSLAAPHEVILPFDPHTRLFGEPIPIPGGAGAMVLASDQRQVRVALRLGGFLNLDPTLAPPFLSPVIPVDLDPPGAPVPVVAMASLAGRPETTAVAVQVSNEPARFQMVILDGATARPLRTSIDDAGRIDALAFEADGQSVHVGADSGYRRHRVGPQGVEQLPMGQPRADLPGRFEWAHGRLYFEAGPVITAAPEIPGSPLVAGFLPYPGVLVVSPSTDQLFVISGNAEAEAIKAFEASTLREQWERSFVPSGAAGSQLLVISTNRVLARFNDSTAMTAGIDEPSAEPAADLRLSAIRPIGWSAVGATFTYMVSIENLGPWSASGVRLLHSRPPGLEWIAVENSQGTTDVTGSNLAWEVGLVSSHRTARITFQCRALVPGIHLAAASVRSGTADPDPSNNAVDWELFLEPPPTVSVADFTYVITSDRAGFFDVPVQISPRGSLPISAKVVVIDGTAREGTDFQVPRPILTIPPGSAEANIRINLPPSPQPLAERAFVLGLTNITQARPFRDQALVRLRDARVPAVTVSGGSQHEGGPGAPASIPFTVSLSSTFPAPVHVEYQTANATARDGIDFRSAQGTLIFPPGVTERTLAIDVFGNDVREEDRRFQLVLGSVTNGRLGVAAAEGIILDDDRHDAPGVLLHHVSVQDGQVRLAYTVATGWFVVVEATSAWGNPVPWKAITEPRLSDGRLTEVTDTLGPEPTTQRFYRLSVRP
jgi:uncharacterized repeat protein (TIGR01451 family)